MEYNRLPRHSSSHGTLHSSYSSHGRPGHGPSPVRPLHKPLRSVNENSVLLPSPGALESMLKTTTETGDIGIFSIKPVPPSPQRTDTLSEIGHLNPSPRPSIDRARGLDNGKQPPSCRDAASEIISMYGSESHKSATSTLSPTSTEDIGQRSYSMTTCGSRHLSHHKSTTTLQSQTSGGPLQRPRSPFPYPTRLKRPGVRPASPALTEGGRVDYSRMVEIDRISYRTVHGTYKPSFPLMPRRPPPLGLRIDANRSTNSLSTLGPPLSRHGPRGAPSMRTHSAASIASWNSQYRERLDSPSSRTSSLTSIVNMYHRTQPAFKASPNGFSAAIPRYYDYTEDFESKQPRIATPVQPLAPIPTHCRRPLVLQESSDHSAVAFRERDSAFFEPENQENDDVRTVQASRDNTPRPESRRQAARDRAPSRCRTSSVQPKNREIGLDDLEISKKFIRVSDIDLLPSQAGRDSMDTFNPSLDPESKDAPTYRYTDYRTTATPKTKTNSPKRQVQVQGGDTPTIRSEQGVILRDDTQDQTLHEEEIGGNDNVNFINEQIQMSPQGKTERRRSCSEPVLGLLETSIQQEGMINNRNEFVSMGRASSHYSTNGALGDKAGIAALPGTDYPSQNTSNSGTSAINERTLDNGYSGVNVPPCSTNQALGILQRQRFQRHKRNQAVPRISTTCLPREDNECFPHILPSCSSTPIVEPKPISPARQLKLKNSIPQLMKALPPLPGDPDYIPPPTPSISSIPDDEYNVANVLVPFKFPPSSTPRSSRDIGIGKPDSSPNNDLTPGLQRNIPKLKLKLKMSTDSGGTNSSDIRLLDTNKDKSWSTKTPNSESGLCVRAHNRNRLKLRHSKSTTNTPPPSTIRRNLDAETSNIIANIARHQPRDLFSFPIGLSSAVRHVSRNSSQPTDIFRSSVSCTHDIVTPTCAASQRKPATEFIHVGSRNKLTYDARSLETRSSSDPRLPRGLKKRLSNLRCLLTRPSDSALATSSQVPARGGKENEPGRDVRLTNANFTSKHFAANNECLMQGNNTRTTVGRRVRAKLLKWVKDAKIAVRVYAKRNRGA